MRTYSQYLAWHIVAVESIKKLILNLDDFYSDITGENQPLSIVEHEQIKNEVRIGWIFEALSHAEQAIEDLFSFLMLSKNIDTFVKNVVNYNATDVKRYIWNFKTNDPSKFLGEFFRKRSIITRQGQKKKHLGHEVQKIR